MAWMGTREALAMLPRILLRRGVPYSFDGMPLVANRLSWRKSVNLVKAGVDMMLRSDRAICMPPAIQVEPTNVCNLNCRLCPTGSGSLRRPQGFMSMETFERILHELGEVLLAVILYGWGEPFLNAELPDMIEACAARGILTVTSTNGQCIQSVDQALRVVDAGLSGLIIAIDGSTQEIFESFRCSGDLEKVKRCATLIEEAKRRRGSQLPYTNLRVVVTRGNEADLANLEGLARQVGVNMFSYKSVGSTTDSSLVKDYEPTDESMRRYEYDGSGRRHRPPIQCPYPFRQPTVFWDGTVVGCEYDYDADLPWGKIGPQRFARIWNGRQAMQLRRSIRKGPERPAFCSRCPYQDSVGDSCVLSCTELRAAGGARTARAFGAERI